MAKLKSGIAQPLAPDPRRSIHRAETECTDDDRRFGKPPTKNKKLLEWVEESRRLTQPTVWSGVTVPTPSGTG
jgi:hypothetical protein